MKLLLSKYRLHLLALLWPVLYFLNYLLPVGDGRLWRLANDFGGLYHDYKTYLFHALNSLHFPLWSPTEGAGYPLFTNPFASLFYPLNAVFYWVYPLIGHYPGVVHQGFTIVGVSILCLGLFVWLKSLGFRPLYSLLAAIVFSVCLKISDILRFPNAVHTAAWMPWVLYAFNQIYTSPRNVRPILMLVSFSVFLLTGGYPYFYYYSAFLFAPYLFCLSIPKLRRTLFPFEIRPVLSVLPRILAATALLAAILGPYFYKLQIVVKQTTDREGHDLFYSAEYPFHWLDVLGAFIFPQATQTEGVYYFGVAGTFFVLFELIRKPRPLHGYFFLLWSLVTTISFTDSSPLFLFLWKHLPGFSNLRVWTRMNILFVPMGAWLFASSLSSFSDFIASHNRVPRRSIVWFGLVMTALFAQIYLFKHRMFHHYWNDYIGAVIPSSLKEVHSLLFGWVSFGCFLICLFLIRRPLWTQKRAQALAVLVTALCVGDVFVIGRYFWSMPQIGKLQKYEIPISAPIRSHEGSASSKVNQSSSTAKEKPPSLTLAITPGAHLTPLERRFLESFRYPRIEGHLMIQNTPQFSVGTFPSWYYKRYTDFLKRTRHEKEARDRLLGIKGGQRLFCSTKIDYSSIAAFLADSDQCHGRIAVTFYNGDRIDLDVTLEKEAYLSFIDNWDTDWHAFVDDVEVPIERLFGTFKAIRLAVGIHQVRFSYTPKLLGSLTQRLDRRHS